MRTSDIIFPIVIVALLGTMLWAVASDSERSRKKAIEDYKQCRNMTQDFEWCFAKFKPDLSDEYNAK